MRFFYRDLSYQLYRCAYEEEEKTCNHPKVQQNYLIMTVMEQIRHLIKVACDRDKLLKNMEKKSGSSGKLNSLRRKVARLDEKIIMTNDKITKAYMDFSEGLLEEDEYQFVKQKLATDKIELENAKNEVKGGGPPSCGSNWLNLIIGDCFMYDE